jgi:hypothetical protein
VADERRWLDEAPLPEFKEHPPAELIRVRGGRVVRVYQVDDPHPQRREGFTDAVLLAWAHRLEGGWGMLLAWLGTVQVGVKTTGEGRWGWCRYLADRTVPITPYLFDEEDEWYGNTSYSELGKGVQAAVASLPVHLREAALRPAPPLPGPRIPGPPRKDP